MLTDEQNWPVTFHPTWNIYDASKLKTYTHCPRMYFYEYVLGWRPEGLNIHLIFGEAWHEAMAYILLNGHEMLSGVEEILRGKMEIGLSLGEAALEVIELFPLIKGAFHAFLDKYREEVTEDLEYLYEPKVPSRAALALLYYCSNRSDMLDYDVEQIGETKAVEIAGKGMLTDEDLITFRFDSILRSKNSGKIRILEHKTGSSSYNWAEQWDMDIQCGLYNFILRCMYPPNKVDCVWINGVLFKKTKYVKSTDLKSPFRHFELIRQPVYKTTEQMEMWYYSTFLKIKEIQLEFRSLLENSPKDNIMTAFPFREVSCHSFYGRPCTYKDFCVSWPNPLRRCDECPPGIKVEYWDPMEKDTNIYLDIRPKKEEA